MSQVPTLIRPPNSSQRRYPALSIPKSPSASPLTVPVSNSDAGPPLSQLSQLPQPVTAPPLISSNSSDLDKPLPPIVATSSANPAYPSPSLTPSHLFSSEPYIPLTAPPIPPSSTSTMQAPVTPNTAGGILPASKSVTFNTSVEVVEQNSDSDSLQVMFSQVSLSEANVVTTTATAEKSAPVIAAPTPFPFFQTAPIPASGDCCSTLSNDTSQQPLVSSNNPFLPIIANCLPTTATPPTLYNSIGSQAQAAPLLSLKTPGLGDISSQPHSRNNSTVANNGINNVHTPSTNNLPSGNSLTPFPFPVKKSASKTVLASLSIPLSSKAPQKTYTAVSESTPNYPFQSSSQQQPLAFTPSSLASNSLFHHRHHSSSSSSASEISAASSTSATSSCNDTLNPCDPFVPPLKPPPSPKHPSIFLDTSKIQAAAQRELEDSYTNTLKIEDTLVFASITGAESRQSSISITTAQTPMDSKGAFSRNISYVSDEAKDDVGSGKNEALSTEHADDATKAPADTMSTNSQYTPYDAHNTTSQFSEFSAPQHKSIPASYYERYSQMDVADLDEEGWRAIAEAGDIEELGKLGEGAGGSVTRCRLKNRGANSKVFALKAITTNPNPEVQKQILRELQFNRTCNSPHIVKYFGTFLSEETASIFIAMEYCGGGSLEAIYKRVKARDGRIGEKVLGKVAEGVLSGLSYLHERKIIHRDIKPQNILLDAEGQVKLCDFGVSGEVVNSLATTFTGTSYYMAPERIQGQPYTVTSDVWSLGLTIMEVAQHRFPFLPENHEPLTPIELLSVIVNMPAPDLKDEPEEGIKWSESFRHFLKSCLEKDPRKRASPRQMLMHPWIVGQRHKSVKMAKFVRECWS